MSLVAGFYWVHAVRQGSWNPNVFCQQHLNIKLNSEGQTVEFSNELT